MQKHSWRVGGENLDCVKTLVRFCSCCGGDSTYARWKSYTIFGERGLHALHIFLFVHSFIKSLISKIKDINEHIKAR